MTSQPTTNAEMHITGVFEAMARAEELANALEEAVGVLLACVKPAGGCDDGTAIQNAIEQGEAALAAAGRLRVREP